MITVTAFKSVPDFARGLVRDLRVRWALEEAGLAYRCNLIGRDDLNTDTYRALQPFGQVPAYEEDGLRLFESGAILLHIGERSETLLPKDAAGKARAMTWVFAALNSMEPAIQELAGLDAFYAGQGWVKDRRPMVEERVKLRLAALAKALGDRDYLEGRFTAGDLMMATVLRILRHTDLIAEQPRLKAYLARNEARPSFKRALADQIAAFEVAPAA